MGRLDFHAAALDSLGPHLRNGVPWLMLFGAVVGLIAGVLARHNNVWAIYALTPVVLGFIGSMVKLECVGFAMKILNEAEARAAKKQP